MTPNKLFFFFNIVIIMVIIIVGVALAWTNPTANPPSGGGALRFSGGNVGIGTVGPLGRLHVVGNIVQDNTNTLQARNSAGMVETWMWPRESNNVMFTNFGDGGWNIRNNASDNIMFMTPAGSVGIGTTNPGAKLEIFGAPGTQRITTIPLQINSVYNLSWDAFEICQFGTCCPPWRDCDGDGKTYSNRTDCDEGCSDCFVGSGAFTTWADRKDQNCNGVVDEEALPGDIFIILNSQSDISCDDVCRNMLSGGSCYSIGTDIDGLNGLYRTWQSGCVDIRGDCGDIMRLSWGSCEGNVTNWTNCRCLSDPATRGYR